jgi:pimeloyl-ACP methyl ester carboxylesterase
MTAGHFIFIPAVLLFGLVIGWILGSRAAADAYAAELKRREARATRAATPTDGRPPKGSRPGASQALGLLLLGAIVLTASACGSDEGVPDSADPTASQDQVDVRRRVFDLGPVDIEALVAGEEGGQAIVMLADIGRDAGRFLDFVPHLVSAGLRPVVLNPRGIGASVGPLENLTLHDLAADVAGVIEALDVGSVHVLGYGFGNRVARCLAVDRPELVEGLILLGAGGQVPGDPEAIEALDRLLESGLTDEEELAALQTAMFAPGSDASVWLELPAFPEVGRAQSAADRETPNEDWLFGGAAPILIIQGRHDRLAPPENGRWLRERLGSRVQLVELADSGHALMPEQTAEVVDAITDFVSGH